MPGFDRKGPMGEGPLTGRGYGACAGQGGQSGRGLGRGRGIGNRRFCRWRSVPAELSKEDQKKILQNQLEVCHVRFCPDSPADPWSGHFRRLLLF